MYQSWSAWIANSRISFSKFTKSLAKNCLGLENRRMITALTCPNHFLSFGQTMVQFVSLAFSSDVCFLHMCFAIWVRLTRNDHYVLWGFDSRGLFLNNFSHRSALRMRDWMSTSFHSSTRSPLTTITRIMHHFIDDVHGHWAQIMLEYVAIMLE